MFFLALIVPGIFLIFGDWKNLAIVWALAGLLSFAAFEFATNALRQSLGLGVLILGIHFLVRGRYAASLASAAAAITFHVSAIAFGPFLAYIATREFIARAGRLAQLSMATLAVVSLSIFAWIFADEVNAFFSARRLWYQEGSSPFFLVFVHIPVILTFGIRVVSTRGQVSHLELSFFCYVILLASATLILFPAILYRLALTSAFLQLYLASIASNASPKQAGWVLLGLSMHLLSFFMLSEYARGVIGV